MPTLKKSDGLGAGADLIAGLGDSGSAMGGAEGLRGRLPDWASETETQLHSKLPIRNEIKNRETAVICDMRFSVASRARVL